MHKEGLWVEACAGECVDPGEHTNEIMGTSKDKEVGSLGVKLRLRSCRDGLEKGGMNE